MHEGQRPAEHSRFRLLQGAWLHSSQSARREGPRDEVGGDQITVSLNHTVQFKEKDAIRWHC